MSSKSKRTRVILLRPTGLPRMRFWPYSLEAFDWRLLACILVVSGCGMRAPHPAVLTMVGFGLEAGEQLKQDALDEFTRTTGIRVDLSPAWGSSAEQLSETSKLLKLRANPPDVYVIDV